jgi:hypothetical protein
LRMQEEKDSKEKGYTEKSCDQEKEKIRPLN